MDIKTKCNVGFAFINMTSPVFILDLYLEFHYQQWTQKVEYCKSRKLCEIMYANMQGLIKIQKNLNNKSIMRKNDKKIKPIFYENMGFD